MNVEMDKGEENQQQKPDVVGLFCYKAIFRSWGS
jgi:hypothetical protein